MRSDLKLFSACGAGDFLAGLVIDILLRAAVRTAYPPLLDAVRDRNVHHVFDAIAGAAPTLFS